MPARRSPSPGAVLAGACAAQAAVSFVTFGLPAVGPELRHAYGLSLTALGAVLTANLLGSGLSLIAAGAAVDRVGSRTSLLAGTAVAVTGLLVAGHGHSGAILFAGLVLAGAGSAIVPVAGAGALFRVYGPARRAWAFGVRQMAVPLGGTISAVCLPALEAAGGVRLALDVAAGVVAATGVAFALLLENERREVTRSERVLRRILQAPGMGRLLLVACLYIVVLQGLLTYTVPAVRAAGLSSFTASATYFGVNATAVVARLVWGRVADGGGGSRRVRTLADTGALAAAGAVLFALALHAGAAAAIPAAAVFAFGASGWNGILYVSAGERAPAELAGRSFAVAATVVFVVSAACTPPLGTLAAHTGWDAFWLVSGGIAVAGALVAARLPRLPAYAAPLP